MNQNVGILRRVSNWTAGHSPTPPITATNSISHLLPALSTLKMATAMFAEMLDSFQHLTQLISET
jgi:hypothetical protein